MRGPFWERDVALCLGYRFSGGLMSGRKILVGFF